MAHTLTPWHTDIYHGIHGNSVQIADARNSLLAETYSGPAQDDNAEFIVQACNAHDGLLEVCKLVKSVTQQTENSPANQLDRIFDIVSATIASAEPKEDSH